MEALRVIFAYIGPEVALPVASLLTAVLGFVLMVGRAPLRFAARVFRRVSRGLGFNAKKPARRPSPVVKAGKDDRPSTRREADEPGVAAGHADRPRVGG
jgi:hypothetical protein